MKLLTPYVLAVVIAALLICCTTAPCLAQRRNAAATHQRDSFIHARHLARLHRDTVAMQQRDSLISYYRTHRHHAAIITQQDSLLRHYRTQHFKYWALLLGYHGLNYHNFEVGLSHNKVHRTSKYTFTSSNYYISTEGALRNTRFIAGPKAGCWFSASDLTAAWAVGLAGIYYTDLTAGSLRLRPEVGFGLSFIKLSYGYNIPITNTGFMGVNKSVFSLQVCIPLTEQKWPTI